MSKTGRLRDVQDYSSLSSNSLDRMEEKNNETLSNSDAECTQDGSLDCRGNPASKHKTGNWKACPFILGNECCERLAYYGISTNLVNYIHTKFNEDSSTASNSVTNWSGTCYITPLIGAFMADAYWGRYWTIAVFSCVYFVGMSLLTISSSVPKLKPPCSGNDSECHPSAAHIGVFYLALYLIALGTGGIKPCVSSFGADQFDETDKTEQKRKSSFFNWFYFSINVGALISSSVLVWIQENVGWSWGFGIPTVAMAIAVVSFFSGTVLYRHQKPGGSPLTRIAQVLVASIRKWNVKTPEDSTQLFDYQDKESGIEGSRKLLHTKQFRCLDKAAIPTANDESKGGSLSPWKLCTVTQVEELKAIIRILPIWATGIVFNTVYSQMSTLFVLQGDTMDPHIGSFKIPAASLSIFDTLSVLIWVPIYDRIIVPVVRRYTGHQRGFTQLQRMGIGLLISIFSMVVAAIVEIKRLQIVRKHNYYNLETIPMSILWQIFQYFLIGAAEVFNNIGQIEFFYDQAPDAMRSLCSALSLTTNALGNYLSTLLVTVVTHITRRNGKPGWIPDNLNYGHIDYFFWLLAVLSFLNLLVYLGISHWYKYKKTSGSFQVSK